MSSDSLSGYAFVLGHVSVQEKEHTLDIRRPGEESHGLTYSHVTLDSLYRVLQSQDLHL